MNLPMRFRFLLLALFLGFVVSLHIGKRQADEGYVIRIANGLPEDMAVYRRAAEDNVHGTTHRFAMVDRGETSRPITLRRGDACELLFAPRGTVQRIARVELPKDALRVTAKTDGPLLVTLGPDGPEVTALPEGDFSHLGWKLPLLYLAVIGWIFTLTRHRVCKIAW